MTQQIKLHNHDAFVLSAEDGITEATFIPERGGIGASLIMPTREGARELLFQHDFFASENWYDLPGGWPFLFPVCARTERLGQAGMYLYHGRQYTLPMHGFAWQMPWEVVAADERSLVMVLRDNEQTFAMYPFRFSVELHYALSPGLLTCQQTYTNLTDRPMPYYAGFHPYFTTPNKSQVTLNYQPVSCLQYNTTLTDIIGEKPLFSMPGLITDPAINEQLTQVGEDKKVTLQFANQDCLSLTASGIEDANLFSYIQLYTMEQKDFFCIEPWMAPPNSMNTIGSVRWLKPGQSESGFLRVAIKKA